MKSLKYRPIDRKNVQDLIYNFLQKNSLTRVSLNAVNISIYVSDIYREKSKSDDAGM